jgi:hypothetical protein
MFCKSFLQSTSIKVVSGDKMMNKAWGPVWHSKHKAQGIILARLRGMDQEAAWGKSHCDGWVYGHGSFCLVSHSPCVLGAFKYMRNSAQKATRLWLETGHRRGMVETVMMDGKADDQDLFAEFQRQRGMTLLTTPRKESDHTAERQQMINVLNRPQNGRLRQPRGQTVEPMQGLVKEICALERCWMRGHCHNRWLFAAMGVAMQLQQAKAFKGHCSTWKIKQEVLGLRTFRDPSVAHLDEREDEGRIVKRPLLETKRWVDLVNTVAVVGCMTVVNTPGEGEKRVIIVDPSSNKYTAKDRTGQLGRFIPPNFTQIVEACQGTKTYEWSKPKPQALVEDAKPKPPKSRKLKQPPL